MTPPGWHLPVKLPAWTTFEDGTQPWLTVKDGSVRKIFPEVDDTLISEKTCEATVKKYYICYLRWWDDQPANKTGREFHRIQKAKSQRIYAVQRSPGSPDDKRESRRQCEMPLYRHLGELRRRKRTTWLSQRQIRNTKIFLYSTSALPL